MTGHAGTAGTDLGTPAPGQPSSPGRSRGRRAPTAGRVPVGLGLLALTAMLVIVVPLVALLARTDWAGLPTALADPSVIPAIRLSAMTTLSTTLLAILLGTPLAWFLARSEHRAVPWLRALVTVPLVLPPVVGGVALLMAWGRRGLVGEPLATISGVTIPFTPVAVVFAETFVAMPFYVVTVEATLRTIDRRLDDVAATLGASPSRTFRTVAVPMAAPGIAAGAALAWARALGEFGATITFAGNFTGRTQTAPLAVYTALQENPDTAIALSVVMLLISVTVLGALRGRWLA